MFPLSLELTAIVIASGIRFLTIFNLRGVIEVTLSADFYTELFTLYLDISRECEIADF